MNKNTKHLKAMGEKNFLSGPCVGMGDFKIDYIF